MARLTAKKAARSGALWGYFFGVCVASSALTYLSSYKTAADREKLAANFGANSALAALFGPPMISRPSPASLRTKSLGS